MAKGKGKSHGSSTAYGPFAKSNPAVGGKGKGK